MHLFDPLRPKLANSRPTWLRNHIAISNFEIFPLEDGNIKISIWLPIRDEIFASMRFSKIIKLNSFSELIKDFIINPEETCENLFKNQLEEDLNPELRNNPSPNANKQIKNDSKKLERSYQPLNLGL